MNDFIKTLETTDFRTLMKLRDHRRRDVLNFIAPFIDDDENVDDCDNIDFEKNIIVHQTITSMFARFAMADHNCHLDRQPTFVATDIISDDPLNTVGLFLNRASKYLPTIDSRFLRMIQKHDVKRVCMEMLEIVYGVTQKGFYTAVNWKKLLSDLSVIASAKLRFDEPTDEIFRQWADQFYRNNQYLK